MKRIFTIAVLFMTASVWAQAPEKMSYQAVVRDASNALVQTQAVGMQISILQGSSTGTAVYVETQTPTTNANGLVNLEIGTGTVVSGNFTTIDWANGTYFIKTETDPTGSTSYTITGTSQLLSVPYALHAKTAESVTGSITYAIGDSAQGGIIFWLDTTGKHGLVAATTDQSTGIQWYNGTQTVTHAVRIGIGAGKFDTERIIANQGAGPYAADVCANYQGYNHGDWFLPSKYELNLLYLQKSVVGSFANERYWSSREVDAGSAWNQNFGTGTQGKSYKNTAFHVRVVRAF